MHHQALDILRNNLYAAVATSSRLGLPWNSPVYIVYDDQLNFYWASSKMSQHSRNILENPKVFLVLYDSTVPWGTGRGVFIQAEAVELKDPEEVQKACELRRSRVSDAKQLPDEFLGDKPRRIYRATTKRLWVNQDSAINGFFVDERVEVDVALLKDFLARP